ncbi:hypothetical protein HZH68_004681 [Vespula germanica]|uniref:Uncharacterized protein n=1 Tax=Vespula germanica TaxID=30212 RepID=A0A834NII7_VESGE|nr:hypothetical protein HZH68_004681 [Vespula germanica]
MCFEDRKEILNGILETNPSDVMDFVLLFELSKTSRKKMLLDKNEVDFQETWCKRWWHFSQRNISITARSFEPNLTTILMKNTQASTATKDTRENTSTTSVTEPSGITKNQLSGILERSHIVRIKISIRLWYVPEVITIRTSASSN